MYIINRSKTSAFTLIELLFVIAIIAILAAILFPIFAQAREKARETTCTSNMRQIGLQVRMYCQDFDETMPLFYAYNSQPPTGQPGHKGVELEIIPYGKSMKLFVCPDDLGGPSLPDPQYGCPGKTNYADCYGSSYRFCHAAYSTAANESSQNNSVYTTSNSVTDSSFTVPAETRILRDEMFPFFAPDSAGKYGYYPDYYTQWHPRGGGVVFADGHAKFTVSATMFDSQVACPGGGRSGDLDIATNQTYYWDCD